MPPNLDDLRNALRRGDPNEVRALIDAGADIHYTTDHGYDALIDCVYGRDIAGDSRLIELLALLLENKVNVRGMSSYGESAVRVLSWVGRFDAVRLLLDAGANVDDLELSPLIAATMFGSLADMEDLTAAGADLEAREYMERTPFLVAVLTGDIARAQCLLDHGADRNARGRCGQPALFYAIEAGHTPMLRWLLEIGIEIGQKDEFGNTALITAAKANNLDAVNILLEAGADVNEKGHVYTPLATASTREIALRLLEAGADPKKLSTEGRRAILGYPTEPSAEALDQVTLGQFRRHRHRRFGKSNPEDMTNPFWEAMIRSGLNAYQAQLHFRRELYHGGAYTPTWSAVRFGQSITFLPDGRIVQVAGEHEDGSDPDFCIYNDVFVHDQAGNITIYGYPEDAFPPTDFHTATLIGEFIYIIGSLGYRGARKPGQTQIYRLHTETFRMETVETGGDNPGWISEHRAILVAEHEIEVSGGKVIVGDGETEDYVDNPSQYVLDIGTLTWRREP